MKNADFTYSAQEQAGIYTPEAEKAIDFARKDEFLDFIGHGKLDVYASDDDWRTALLYACGALRDTVNLHIVFECISEESSTCNQLYTPEVYLLSGFDTYKAKKYREIYNLIEKNADIFSLKLAEHSVRCQNDVLGLLHLLVDNNRVELFNEVFNELISIEQFHSWHQDVMKDGSDFDLMNCLMNDGKIIFNVSLDESLDIVVEQIVKHVAVTE